MTAGPIVAVPESCLEAADQLLSSVVRGTRGAWPRACAWLLRLALEAAMDDYWWRCHPEVLPMRARSPQFLILDRYAGRSIAARAGYAWSALSRAGHHHCYELGLTAGELRRLREMVATVISDLAAARVGHERGSDDHD
ncbi:hypothetical protein [Micromonospora sp. WMMA1947]|uniref:hypothetical protein n=1 Tax=Micromonospora sp. WMMA1947 TaxID=3015163 RepID=UPI00248CD267|nr:hypothetical protein [Micromonospora sp. WMMA1947]WBC08861.1 hypothetical protein O7604_27150 [Micromonospora sp. WMMA1947]